MDHHKTSLSAWMSRAIGWIFIAYPKGHCLPEGPFERFPDTDAGHEHLAELAHLRGVVVCFGATGGQEWRLWASLDAAGIQARHKQEVGEPFEGMIAADAALAETAQISRSVPEIESVASAMLIAEMPELGQISGEQAAALTGLSPSARDSGAFRGKRPSAAGDTCCDM